VPSRISYAQNGEDVRLWHAFGPREPRENAFVYVDVGANEPWNYSVTAALNELGWRGLLVEADPELADQLRKARPHDVIVNAAAADREGSLRFHRVPGTGLGTVDAAEAQAARERGFAVEDIDIPALRLDDIIDSHAADFGPDIHAMTIDVEGAESLVLDGLELHRPWVICIEAVEPGTSVPTHQQWERRLLERGYVDVAFDGINRWYVAAERVDQTVPADAGAPRGTTVAQAIATPFHAIDIGEHGWQTTQLSSLRDRDNRAYKRIAWQRELVSNDLQSKVSREEYERQIEELRSALVKVEGSRTFRASRALARAAKSVVTPARKLESSLKASAPVTKQRHLRHVNTNMHHLTPAAFLGSQADAAVEIEPFSQAPPGMDPRSFSARDVQEAEQWLEQNTWDTDEQLFDRLDNRNDTVGRVRAALRTRCRIATSSPAAAAQRGDRIAFDARALQSPAFGTRGIGRFAAAALAATRAAVGDDRISLIVDRGLLKLPDELVGGCQLITRVRDTEQEEFAAVIQPSPMTHSPEPLLPLLLSDTYSLAIVFDFIPLEFPDVYLPSAALRVEYGANLDALLRYRDFACISHTVREELEGLLAGGSLGGREPVVAWPHEIDAQIRNARPPTVGGASIVIASGDDPRKNTFGGLAGVAAATVRDRQRDVAVLGMAGLDDQVHHWSIAAAMRPGESRTLGRIDDAELAEQFAAARVTVVPSFTEGLSLPVIESVSQGTPVVASDIAAHRELLGSGDFLADPASPASIARAVHRTAGHTTTALRQLDRLRRHQHLELETVIGDRLAPLQAAPGTAGRNQPASSTNAVSSGRRLQVAMATPWPPQRSGVADYSAATGRALAELCDLTVFATSDAQLDLAGADHAVTAQRPLAELLEDSVASEFDVVIAVVGNSHFHLPIIELTSSVDCVVIAHDTRMIEYYLALRGIGGAQELMQRTLDPDAPLGIDPSLEDQMADMRLLQNAGLWEVARRARALITHSPTTADLIERQTGVTPTVLPFVNYRPPGTTKIDDLARTSARKRLAITDDAFHFATFGFVDIRTKQVDTLLEAAGWLTDWGHRIALTVVGSAPPSVEAELAERAASLGLHGFSVTGFQDEDRYRDWLLAVDLGVQLRVSPLLGVSGPLADMAAVGTPALASAGLCRDVDAPAFIERLPDVVSPVTLAEAIEPHITGMAPRTSREEQRREYLESHSPEVYAQRLLDLMRQVLR